MTGPLRDLLGAVLRGLASRRFERPVFGEFLHGANPRTDWDGTLKVVANAAGAITVRRSH